MGFRWLEYNDLRNRVIGAIRTLARFRRYSEDEATALTKEYEENKQDPALLAEKYENIDKVRRTQIGVLLTVIRCLDASSKLEKDKVLILTGIVCYIRELIHKSYTEINLTNLLSSFVTSTDKSKLFTYLGFVLNITADNAPTHETLLTVYRALKDFMYLHIYVDPNDLSQGYLDQENEHFTDRKIEAFIPAVFLDKLIKRISVLERYCVEQVNTKEEFKGISNDVGCSAQQSMDPKVLETPADLYANDSNDGDVSAISANASRSHSPSFFATETRLLTGATEEPTAVSVLSS